MRPDLDECASYTAVNETAITYYVTIHPPTLKRALGMGVRTTGHLTNIFPSFHRNMQMVIARAAESESFPFTPPTIPRGTWEYYRNSNVPLLGTHQYLSFTSHSHPRSLTSPLLLPTSGLPKTPSFHDMLARLFRARGRTLRRMQPSRGPSATYYT